MNIEHRTSNIERRMEKAKKEMIVLSSASDIKIVSGFYVFCFIRCWTFDVRCSMFIPFLGVVSYWIKLAALGGLRLG
jgi:hypothetical protein